MRKLIDSHVHIFEHIRGFGRSGELRALGQGYARWATGETIKIIPNGLGDREFLAETVLELMDNNKIEKAVLLQGILYGFMNEYVNEVVTRYPERFVGAGTYDPYALNAEKIFDRLLNELCYRIIKFELSEGGGFMGFHESFEIDGELMLSFWEKANRYNLVVVIDIGSPGMKSYQYQAVAKIAHKYPALQIVIPHLGAPTLATEAEYLKMLNTIAPCQNVAFDLAALQWNVFPETAPHPTALHYLSLAHELIGAKRLLWGTDMPFVLTRFSIEDLVSAIENSGIFSSTELEDVFYWNAERIYFQG